MTSGNRVIWRDKKIKTKKISTRFQVNIIIVEDYIETRGVQKTPGVIVLR